MKIKVVIQPLLGAAPPTPLPGLIAMGWTTRIRPISPPDVRAGTMSANAAAIEAGPSSERSEDEARYPNRPAHLVDFTRGRRGGSWLVVGIDSCRNRPPSPPWRDIRTARRIWSISRESARRVLVGGRYRKLTKPTSEPPVARAGPGWWSVWQRWQTESDRVILIFFEINSRLVGANVPQRANGRGRSPTGQGHRLRARARLASTRRQPQLWTCEARRSQPRAITFAPQMQTQCQHAVLLPPARRIDPACSVTVRRPQVFPIMFLIRPSIAHSRFAAASFSARLIASASDHSASFSP